MPTRALSLQNLHHRRRIDIAAAENHAHPSRHANRAAEQRRHPKRPGRFNHQLHAKEQELHRRDDRRLADRLHIIDIFEHQGKCHHAEGGRACAVGNSGRPLEGVRLVAEDLSAAPVRQLDLFAPIRAMENGKEEFQAYLTLRFGSGTLRFCSELAGSWRERMLGFLAVEGES